MVQQSGTGNRNYTALVEEEWQYQQYRKLFKKRADKVLSADSEQGAHSSMIGTNPDAIKRWITGAAQRLQEGKNLEGMTGSISLAEKAEGRERQSLHPEVKWRQWDKECLDAMNEEIEVKSLFSEI